MYDNVYEKIIILDIGSAAFSETVNHYDILIEKDMAIVYGFEPHYSSYNNLCNSINSTHQNNAILDGNVHPFFVCEHPGKSSFLKPNHNIITRYQSFGNGMSLLSTEDRHTLTLNEAANGWDVDLIKLDTQGSELIILENGNNVLHSASFVEIEVEFIQQYERQPLFSEIEIFLRGIGFEFHSFLGFGTDYLKEYDVDNHNESDRHESWLWADALFIKKRDRWREMDGKKLEKMHRIATICYKIYDFSAAIECEIHRNKMD